MSNWLRRRAQDAEPQRRQPFHHERPLSLTDDQVRALMLAAGPLDLEKRTTFLERVAGRLRLIGNHPSDQELSAAIEATLRSLIQARALEAALAAQRR